MTDDLLIKELLLKFAQDSCSPAEKQLLIQLLSKAKGEGGMPSLTEIQALFAESPAPQMDSDASERIFREIVNQPSKRKIFSRPFLRIAASLTLVVLTGLGLYHYTKPQMLTTQTQYGETRNVILADGSQIKLNANTTIRMHTDFPRKGKREVWIDGEAFFSVARDADRPFIVHTPRGMDIRVLGTEFNVNSRDRQAQVVLNKGLVQVSLAEERHSVQQQLEPGQMIVADPEQPQLYKSDVDTLYYASWKYNLLSFRGEYLREVAQVIEDRYGYRVDFGTPDIRQLRFTGSVPSDDLELVLDMIARTFDLTVRKSEKVITIENR